MNGFLGTSATFLSDLSLLLSLLFGAIAIFGAIQARRKNFAAHSPAMAIAGLLNWIPVILVMVPTWFGLFQEGQILDKLSTLAPAFHGFLGGITQILITYTIVRMYWLKKLPPKRPLWLMRTTLILWLLTLVGGSTVYVVKYVI
jgi:putative membrane protein